MASFVQETFVKTRTHTFSQTYFNTFAPQTFNERKAYSIPEIATNVIGCTFSPPWSTITTIRSQAPTQLKLSNCHTKITIILHHGNAHKTWNKLVLPRPTPVARRLSQCMSSIALRGMPPLNPNCCGRFLEKHFTYGAKRQRHHDMFQNSKSIFQNSRDTMICFQKSKCIFQNVTHQVASTAFRQTWALHFMTLNTRDTEKSMNPYFKTLSATRCCREQMRGVCLSSTPLQNCLWPI